MDIKKFNKVLSAKIAKAKSYENHNNIEIAIELWIEISDLALKASRQPDIEFTYRHMLINKTEQIIQHIKELKNPRKQEPIIEKKIVQNETNNVNEIKEEANLKDKKNNKSVQEDFSVDNSQHSHKSVQSTYKIIENSDIINKPKGIEEIEASKDFKIITPHDANYIEKMKKLSNETDLNIYKKSKSSSSPEEIDPNEKKICFACGAILPPNAKACSECGTKLK